MSDDELRDLLRTRDAGDDQDEPEVSEDQLRPLRAIWLEMPDEEAPVRGLDALMAAASAKAAVMAPPPVGMWQRFLDLFKQPPVLALATIVVLVGGAALVNRHEDKLDAVSTVETPATPANAELARERLSDAAPVIATPPAATTVAPPAGSAVAELPKVEPARPRKPVMKSPPAPKPERAPPEPTIDGRIGGATAVPVEEAKPAAPEASRPPPRAVVTQPSTADDNAHTETVSPDAAHGPATTVASVDQLLKQCQTAAARGDCSAVRVIADRIARANATFYRARVTKDSAIVKCLGD